MSQEIEKYGTALTPQSESMFFNVEKFEHAQRVARVLSSSTLVPEHFRGEKNLGNVLIAMNYAERIGADPFMAMQNMTVIHGKPGLEGKLVISLVNHCGRFDPIEFDEIGNISQPDKDEDGCVAYATDLKSGKVLRGPKVDWAMVKAEGWLTKNGSKWKTMPGLMFRYRAATYFARTYCPEVLLGMQTKEELIDSSGSLSFTKSSSGAYEAETKALSERLIGNDAAAIENQEADLAPEPPTEPAAEEPAQEPAIEMITDAQVKKLNTVLGSLGNKDNAGKKQVINNWLETVKKKPPVTSSKELTKADASELIDALEREAANLNE